MNVITVGLRSRPLGLASQAHRLGFRGLWTVNRLANSHKTSPHEGHQHSHGMEHGHSHGESQSHSHSHSLLGHSHSHSAADNVLLQESGGLRNPAIRITWIGLLTNLGMAVGKGIGGVVFHSQALLADSVHALSDLVADFMTLATVTVSKRTPTEMFPYGFGKVETLGTVGVSGLLLFAGVSMGWNGLFTMLFQCFDNLPSWVEMLANVGGHHHHHATGEATNLNAMWLALGSIGIKEWLYHATMRVADRTGSTVLVANAWHHRVDSLVSIVAVATIGGGYLFGIQWLDPLGGLIVSSIIAHAGYTTAKTATIELAGGKGRMDAERHAQEAEKIRTLLQGSGFDLAKVELMPSGANYSSIVQLAPQSAEKTLQDFDRTAHHLKHQLYADSSLKRLDITLRHE